MKYFRSTHIHQFSSVVSSIGLRGGGVAACWLVGWFGLVCFLHIKLNFFAARPKHLLNLWTKPRLIPALQCGPQSVDLRGSRISEEACVERDSLKHLSCSVQR